MKNSSNPLLQLLKWTSPLAVALLVVSLSQTASAQMFGDTGPTATFTDVSAYNVPPIPGPNDIFQTNYAGAITAGGNGSWSYYDNNHNSTSATQTDPGETFYLAPIPGAAGYTVTNLFVEINNGGTGANFGEATWDGSVMTPNAQFSTVQPYRVSFYQMNGTSDPSGLASNATLIASVITAPGRMTANGRWMSFSNFQVFLAPGTTNAVTWSRTTNGVGYAPYPLVPNSTKTSPGPFAGGNPICIFAGNLGNLGGLYTPGGVYNVNYGVTVSNATYYPGYLTNYDTVFSIGIATNFQPPIISTDRKSVV